MQIAINGFGRIGKLAFRAAMEKGIDIVAINSVGNLEDIVYMLKYDSVHGRFQGEIRIEGVNLVVNGKKIRYTSERDPAKIDWASLGGEVCVLECTGVFLTTEKAMAHIAAGAKKVIMSAPPKDDTPMYVMGVNHKEYKGELIISNASCTTNCVAPLVKLMNDNFGFIEGLMTTVHSATASQVVVDSLQGKDLRGSRSVFNNIIPATTGAAKAVGKIIPSLSGKITGVAFRVPTSNVSVVDLTFRTGKSTSYEQIKEVIKSASAGELKGILAYTEEPLVSSDLIGDSHSSIFDANAGLALNDHFIKIVSWYDNEWGYSNRTIEMVEVIK